MNVLSGDYSKIQRSNYFYLKSDTKSTVEYKQLMQIAAGGTAGYPVYPSSVYFCGALISQSPNENFCTIIQQPPRLCSDRSHVICRSKAIQSVQHTCHQMPGTQSSTSETHHKDVHPRYLQCSSRTGLLFSTVPVFLLSPLKSFFFFLVSFTRLKNVLCLRDAHLNYCELCMAVLCQPCFLKLAKINMTTYKTHLLHSTMSALS